MEVTFPIFLILTGDINTSTFDVPPHSKFLGVRFLSASDKKQLFLL
jgi:hypothetical protein